MISKTCARTFSICRRRIGNSGKNWTPSKRNSKPARKSNLLRPKRNESRRCIARRTIQSDLVMFSQQIELHGHIIDSLILPKVLDEILSNGGAFKIEEVRIGQQRTDPSYARIAVSAPTPEAVDELVKKLRLHGAELVREADASFAPAPADGVFPPDFYVTSNQPT